MTTEEVKEIARQAHKGQKRRGGADYYSAHIIDVMRRVAKYRKATIETELEAAILQTAALHDCVEMHGETIVSLREKGVDETVLKWVEILTHRKDEEYSDYILRVGDHYYPRLIKIADIFSNLADNPTDKQRAKYVTALEVLLFETI